MFCSYLFREAAKKKRGGDKGRTIKGKKILVEEKY